MGKIEEWQGDHCGWRVVGEGKQGKKWKQNGYKGPFRLDGGW